MPLQSPRSQDPSPPGTSGLRWNAGREPPGDPQEPGPRAVLRWPHTCTPSLAPDCGPQQPPPLARWLEAPKTSLFGHASASCPALAPTLQATVLDKHTVVPEGLGEGPLQPPVLHLRHPPWALSSPSPAGGPAGPCCGRCLATCPLDLALSIRSRCRQGRGSQAHLQTGPCGRWVCPCPGEYGPGGAPPPQPKDHHLLTPAPPQDSCTDLLPDTFLQPECQNALTGPECLGLAAVVLGTPPMPPPQPPLHSGHGFQPQTPHPSLPQLVLLWLSPLTQIQDF